MKGDDYVSHKDKKKLFLDFDGTIVNTIKRIVDLYNEDFRSYSKFIPINWEDVKTWDFTECNCATAEYINTYFNQPRFFRDLEYMYLADYVIDKLKDIYEIVVVSAGYNPNLREKEKWVKENLSFCKFIGVDLKKYSDKSHIDMSDGVFIDDSSNNLKTSNAKLKICFGETYDWNKDWLGIKCHNWYAIYDLLSKLERK